MDEKVYTTIDGKPVSEAEFDAWAHAFTDEFANMSSEDLATFWQDAELVPYSSETPIQTISLKLSEIELQAIERKADAAGYSREEFIRLAILLALA